MRERKLKLPIYSRIAIRCDHHIELWAKGMCLRRDKNWWKAVLLTISGNKRIKQCITHKM